jgi:hypothetical protein
LYRLVFTGDLVPGKDTDAVVEAFAARFKIGDEVARAIVKGGARHVLKSGLALERGQRYRAALTKVGLSVELEPQDPDWGEGLALDLEPLGLETPSVLGPESELRGAVTVASALALEPIAVERAAPPVSEVSSFLAPESTLGDSTTVRNGRRRRPSEPEPGSTPCPKCAAVAVSPVTGVCQACGVVAERWLARRAVESAGGSGNGGGRVGPSPAHNPYAPPQADLTPPPGPAAGVEGLAEPRSVPAGRGWGWIAEAWPMLKARPLAWVVAVLILIAVSVGLSLLPGVGTLLGTLVGPILTAGLMIGAHQQHGGGGFELGHLFAGFSRNPGRLMLLGVAYLGFAVLLGLTIGIGMVAIVAGLAPGLPEGGFDTEGGLDPGAMETLGPLLLLPVLFALLLGMPLAMAMVFAPALVALNDVPVLQSLKLSFLGCWRNLIPFLVYGLCAMGLLILGALPLGLGLLAVAPLLTIAIYLAYRDIYLR